MYIYIDIQCTSRSPAHQHLRSLEHLVKHEDLTDLAYLPLLARLNSGLASVFKDLLLIDTQMALFGLFTEACRSIGG